MNWFYDFFHVLSVYLTGTSIAVLFVAVFVHTPSIQCDEEDEMLPFEWNFLEELEMLSERELSSDDLKHLRDKQVDVETPAGRVLMSYDDETKSFCYYTDSKVIPFKYLDAVARQFAVEHDAKQICVNYGHDYVVIEHTRNAPTEESSVFVKVKPRTKKESRLKITNRFSHRGTIESDKVTIEERKTMTFGEYKNQIKCPVNT